MKKLIFLLALFSIIRTQAQEIPFPSPSPKGNIQQIVGNTAFKVEYERPSLRGREVYGGLVPWSQVWRTGAGHCTKISFDRPVQIAGQVIPRGTYSLLTIPKPTEWTIILNKDTTLYGSRDYKSADDAIRILTKPIKTKRVYETLNIDIEIVDNNARISIAWDRTLVQFLIETTTNDEVNALIKSELISGNSDDSDNYFGAAAFLLSRDKDLPTALRLVEKAIDLEPDAEWAWNLKIRLCEKMEKYDEAEETIQGAIEMLQAKGNRAAEINNLKQDLDRLAKIKRK